MSASFNFSEYTHEMISDSSLIGLFSLDARLLDAFNLFSFFILFYYCNNDVARANIH